MQQHQLLKNKMLHLTDVDVPKGKKNDDDYNSTPETGIFVTYSPTKTYAVKNNFVNMFRLHNKTTTLLTMLLAFVLCLQQQCMASYEETELNTYDPFKDTNRNAPPTYECQSMELKHNCSDFHRLHNCTVVTGYLTLSPYLGPTEECFETYKFVNLREITHFLVMANFRVFPSIKEMFPSLTVIRGRRLFRNYAIIFSDYSGLEKLEFKSLIAIQRGHVIVEGAKKLCYTEKINWNRLTLGKGKNNIYPYSDSKCTGKATCRGCKRDACWSNEVCQKFQDDSVISPSQDPKKDCHEECLGGCYNKTPQGCVVCRNYTDHNTRTCVKECPINKYTCSLYLRCYTRQECVEQKKLFIFQNECVADCPVGYKVDNKTSECVACEDSKACRRICSSQSSLDTSLFINDIGYAETLQFCQIINGSLVIEMYEFFNPAELNVLLRNIVEITDYLKIVRSPYLTSLDFLQNLEKIHGKELENGKFSLIVYNNLRLSELWELKPGFEMLKGGMYIQSNEKLCNRHIKEFRLRAKHDKSLDVIQDSDQEVLCSPATLNIYAQALDHRSIRVAWAKLETSTQVEIIYRDVGPNERLIENSELETEICDRTKWQRELKFFDELDTEGGVYYYFIIKNLEPRTRYALLVKTFGSDDDDTREARSDILYVTTQYDKPRAPTIAIISKTSRSLEIEFSPYRSNSNILSQVVDYYNLEVYYKPDNKELLDERDFCLEPAIEYIDQPHEDYEDCCTRIEKEKRDKTFLSRLKEEFACSLDHKEYCENTSPFEPIFKKRFEALERNFNITNLKIYQLYELKMQACNHAGCSSYSLTSSRTNYSLNADKIIDLTICTNTEHNEYTFTFTKPIPQNGYISSYLFYMRNSSESPFFYFECKTRKAVENSKYIYKRNINDKMLQGAVKVMSFGHYHSKLEWVNVTSCRVLMPATTNIWSIILIWLGSTVVGFIVLYIGYHYYWHYIVRIWRHFRNPNRLMTGDAEELQDLQHAP